MTIELGNRTPSFTAELMRVAILEDAILFKMIMSENSGEKEKVGGGKERKRWVVVGLNNSV